MDASKPARIGEAFLRKEDRRLITGRGTYTADRNLPRQAYARIVRSPTAHAAITGIDATAALELDGVIAVLTAEDLLADGIGPIMHDHGLLGSKTAQRSGPDIFLDNIDGSPPALPPHHLLAVERARYVGEPIAMVIAETDAIARNAADLVEISYDDLPSVVRALDAVAPDAALVWDDVPSNVSIMAEVGNRAQTEAAFAQATHVARIETVIQRIGGIPMEPRCALGEYDAATGKYTLYAPCSGVIRHKHELSSILKIPFEKVRVVAGDVGGSFGTRNAFYSEYGLLPWAARRIGRPIKWTSDRSECFLSDYQGRDLSVEAELALDAEGRFLALRGINTSNLGAYAASHIPLRKGVGLMSNIYAIPAACFIARGVFTNTVPTTPVRSAGRPEAMFVIERLIDIAAAQIGIDRIELRRRNIIGPDALPYANPLGLTYDNGEYEAVMDDALRLADWAGFPERRAAAAGRGRLRGIGLANYVEITTGPPVERAELTVLEDGVIEVAIGTVSSGQGHETSFAQLVSEWLQVPMDNVRLVAGDTDRATVGGGSVSGRSMRFAGVVIGKASQDLLHHAGLIAAHCLGVPADRLSFASGRFRVAGTDRSVSLFDLARELRVRNDLPDTASGPLQGVCQETFTAAGFPYGAQVCEVEIDPETGELEIIRIAAVDDVGRAVNPMIVDGQTHGGAAMGYGQALMEQVFYDPDTGQPLTGSFMDYAMPHARHMPFFDTEISEVPSPSNPLGIRAGGEGGTTPALGAAVNAIVDALSEFGVDHIDMPVTPARIWTALQTRAVRA